MAARIDAVVAPHYKAGDPGATLLVIKDGKTLLRKADGMADLNKGVPMQPGMALRLGSVTKQFTSTAILMLADEGKLELSDPVTKYFPDYSSQGKSITMEHLLTHTSGITNYTSKVAFALLPNRDRSVTQIRPALPSPLRYWSAELHRLFARASAAHTTRSHGRFTPLARTVSSPGIR